MLLPGASIYVALPVRSLAPRSSSLLPRVFPGDVIASPPSSSPAKWLDIRKSN
jgi:hypothetical protein